MKLKNDTKNGAEIRHRFLSTYSVFLQISYDNGSTAQPNFAAAKQIAQTIGHQRDRSVDPVSSVARGCDVTAKKQSQDNLPE